MAYMKTSVSGFLTLQQQLQVLRMKPSQRKQLLKKTARAVQKNSRKRIREQKDLHGKSFAPRSRAGGKSNRRKMLRGLSKQMVNYATPGKGVVSFKTAKAGRIASEHQYGATKIMTAAKMQQLHGAREDGSATRQQAKALKAEGFKRPRGKGKGYTRATVRWITENMSQAQAGLVLRKLRAAPAPKAWAIPIPARSFLGSTESEQQKLVQDIFEQTRKSMRAKK